MVRIGVSDFVRRQTPESPHNHFAGTWDELCQRVQGHWEQRRVSPHNPGVMLVPMPTELLPRFFTSIVEVGENTPLHAHFTPRTEGEDPFIQVTAPGYPKLPAKRVDIIAYSHEILAEDGDAPEPQHADYYIVSINAYATEADEPMNPMTMARNFLHLKGGTQPKTPYTAQEFAESIVYWSRHVRISAPE